MLKLLKELSESGFNTLDIILAFVYFANERKKPDFDAVMLHILNAKEVS